MSRDDGFLGRWSRRKAEARSADVAETPLPKPAPAEGAVPGEGTTLPAGPAEPAFDLASLPTLDSITAATDVSVFMRAGVPESLRNAALRKAWASDPAIRDHIGLSEYAWDFNTPGAIEGFGEIAPGTDVAKIVREIMEGIPSVPVTESAEEAPASTDIQPASLPGDGAEDMLALDASHDDAQAETVAPESAPAPRRRHGGATPR